MPLSGNEKQERLSWLADIIRQAGKIILKRYHGKAKVDWKNGSEPVTSADRASNDYLVQQIAEAFPDEGLLSEEAFDDFTRLEHDRVWMVDPLDGTREFINRNGEFSVMIGLVENGHPVLGAVYQPTEDLLYLGAKDVLAELSEKGEVRPLAVSGRLEIEQYRLVVSRSHLEPVVEDIRESLGINNLLHSGSVGLKCGLIAQDESDLYFHTSQHAKLWDSCAPQAIVEAAGGIMTDLSGELIRYQSREVKLYRGMLASNGKVHAQLVERLQEPLYATI